MVQEKASSNNGPNVNPNIGPNVKPTYTTEVGIPKSQVDIMPLTLSQNPQKPSGQMRGIMGQLVASALCMMSCLWPSGW